MIAPMCALPSLSMATKPWAGWAAGPCLRHPWGQMSHFQYRQSKYWRKKEALSSFGLGLWGNEHGFGNNHCRQKLFASPQHQERLTVNELVLRKPKWLHQEVLTPTNPGRTVPSSSANSSAEVCSNRFSNPRNLDLLISFWDELVILNCALTCMYSSFVFSQSSSNKSNSYFLRQHKPACLVAYFTKCFSYYKAVQS